ncbi:GNAT family N-acetyltransferase [Tritonibacter mobilis]|uniref:GNAT family N-acetyltransferase n=1 Tax=Tritonibacter mobilis TaxID=379347 RepID=UPI000806AE75|nr:GNAT family N-acetyltransferase [Tritonibacter mobilis]
MDLSIVRASPQDFETVAGLVHALLQELSGGKATPIGELEETAQVVLSKYGVFALLALSEGQPVGVVVLNECAAIYAGGEFGEITELYVRPEARSLGVAARLVEAAIVEATRHGWHRIEVGAPPQPEWARTMRFYLRNGFEEVGPRLRRRL